MKGLVIERALPSNVLDIYALFKEACKEGVFTHPIPSDAEVRSYYLQLLHDLPNPGSFVFLARKGRSYWGYCKASLMARPWGKSPICYLEMVFVQDKRRKLGLAKKLTDKLKEECRRIGVSEIELMCHDNRVEYYAKKHQAVKKLNLMIIDLEE